MKFTAKRLLAAGVVGIAAIVAPLSLAVVLTGVGGAPISPAGASAFDQILFNQPSSGADTFQYVPASGQVFQPQTATISGKCASASSPPAILNVCGELYTAIDYTGTPSPVAVGSNGQSTGVGGISPSWTIDNKSNKGAEALRFSPENVPNGEIGSNRSFTEATIPITRKDTGVSTNPSLTVQLAELDSHGTVLATQDCTLTGNTGTTITVDTNTPGTVNNPPGPGNCHETYVLKGVLQQTPSAFSQVEVRDTQTSTSISVGPGTATFTLANTVCGGQTVNANATQGSAAVSLTLNEAAGVCKSFTSFTSTNNAGVDDVEFDASASTDLHFTAQFVWPAQAYCTPGLPSPCAADTVSYSDPVTGAYVSNQDQTYCAAAAPADQLCTTNKTFNYLEPQTTVAAGSNTQAIGSLTSGQLSVVSTSGLLASGQVTVVTSGGLAVLKYSGTSGGNTLIGVTVISGSNAWVVSTGDAVAQTGQPSTTVPAPGSNGVQVGSLTSLNVTDASGLLPSGQVTVATITGSTTGSAVLNYNGIFNNTLNIVGVASGSGAVPSNAPVDQTQTVIVETWSGLLDWTLHH
jgi:hypothetical protein